MHLFTIALAALALLVAVSATEKPKTICYYESWVPWSHRDDNSLCTHMVYSYFGIDSKTHEIKLLDKYLMNDLEDLKYFVKNAGKAQPFISIGGPSIGASMGAYSRGSPISDQMSDQFSRTAANEEYRTVFIKSVVRFLSKYGFTGVMIDWYGAGNNNPDDTKNMVALLDKFDELFASTEFSLAITVPADVNFMNNYDIPKIIPYVDFLNVLTFDYAGPWGNIARHASPLPKQFEALEKYHSKGAPRNKIVMAVPLFARTWKLQSASKQEDGDYAISAGSPGPFTETAGLLSYNELCTMIQSKPSAFSIVRDDFNSAVHAVYTHDDTTEFISFEDPKTLAKKAYNITTEGYAGIAVYTLSNEDWYGICGKKYPLLHAITENYNSGKVNERPDPPTTTPAPPTMAPTDPPGVFICHKEGVFRDPIYCFKYIECTVGELGAFEKVVKYCYREEGFDEDKKKCVPKKSIKACPE